MQVIQSNEGTGGCFITFMGSLSENEADILESRTWIQLYLKTSTIFRLFQFCEPVSTLHFFFFCLA